MQIAIFTTFAASKKEPLAEAITRIHDGFVAAGFGEPCIHFVMSDPPPVQGPMYGVQRVSSIARVLKRWPALETFARGRIVTNATGSGEVIPVDFAIVREIAQGVPRSFPFHSISLHFSARGFSERSEQPVSFAPQALRGLALAGVDLGAGDPTMPGVKVKDAWWVSGRTRHVAAMRFVETAASAKKLPPPPPEIATLYAACGKVRKTVQVPVAAPLESGEAAPPVAKQQAIRTLVKEYRAKLPQLTEALPYDLPQTVERSVEESAGPKKPALDAVFAPLGYECRGSGGGSFQLQRRTPQNLAVKLTVDVGTWSNMVTAIFQVTGMIDGVGFKATLMLPPSRHAAHPQFPIGGSARWQQIVENLAALVAELDRSFVPAVEAASGPSPQWFTPEA